MQPSQPNRQLTFASLFTGVGGFDRPLERAGMRCLWQAEIDKQCRSVLRRHWPDVICYDDVRRVRAYLEPKNERRTAIRLERPDLLCGGFPCQDLSVAGRRAGLAGGRSGLWFTFRRIAALLRPRWLLIENVDGLRSSNGGRDLGIILGALGIMGYGWAYRVLDSQWFGLAQRRERVFIVGCLGDWRGAGEVLFERDCLPWDSAPSRTTRESVAASLTRGADSGGRAGTVSSKWAKGTGGPAGDECYNLVSHTLRGEGFDASEDGTGRETPLIASTIPASDGGPNDYTPIIFDARNITSKGNRLRSRAPGQIENASTTVAFQTRIARNGRGQPKDITDALTSCEGGTHADSKPHVTATQGVRRLTPRECERLQGWPDDWTRWDADGNELADSPRYRMCGNGVSMPPVEWIGRRIVEANQ